jgi:hypothetical protein
MQYGIEQYLRLNEGGNFSMPVNSLIYAVVKDIGKIVAKVFGYKRNQVTLFPGDRWITERNEILQKLLFSDTYLSTAYIKGKDNVSRYWSTASGKYSLDFDIHKRIPLLRRVVILGQGLSEDSFLENDKNEKETISNWMKRQHKACIDVRITESESLEDVIFQEDIFPFLKERYLLKLAKRKKNRKISKKIEAAVGQPDFKIMDIGIYGSEAIGCQITDDLGVSVFFVLSRRKKDIEKGKKYFHRVCNHAKIPEWI